MPIKQINCVSLSNNKIKIRKPHFTIIQYAIRDDVCENLHSIIENHIESRKKKISSKSNHFIDYCLIYLGLFHMMFCTINVLTNYNIRNVHLNRDENNNLNRDNNQSYLNRDKCHLQLYLYRDEITMVDSPLYNSFDFN